MNRSPVREIKRIATATGLPKYANWWGSPTGNSITGRRTGLLMPSLRAARGSGTQRLYSYTDLVQLRVIKRLRDTGISLAKIRKAIEWLRSEIDEQDPLKDSTLLSDGIDIWTSDNSDETQQYLMDILRRGQGVFAIAVGQVQRDLEGEILELFPTQAQPGDVGNDAEATAT